MTSSFKRPDTSSEEAAIFRGEVVRFLEALTQAKTSAARRFRLDQLERAIRRADPTSVPQALLPELERAGVEPDVVQQLKGAPCTHGVFVALIGDDDTAMCRLMHIVSDPSGLRTEAGLLRPLDANPSSVRRAQGSSRRGSSLEFSARRAIGAGIEAASEHCGRMPSEFLSFVPQVDDALRGVVIEGSSLGAAAFVSCASYFTGRHVVEGTAVTGAIERGRLASVGGIAAKVRAAAARPDIRRLLMPEPLLVEARIAREGISGDLEVVGVQSLEELLARALHPEPARIDYAAEVDRLRKTVGEAWQGFAWPALPGPAAMLARRIPKERPELLVRVKTMEAQVHRELGRPEIASDLHEEVLSILASPSGRWVPHAERCFFWRHAAMTYRMLGRFEDATEAAAKAAQHAIEGSLRRDFIFALGTQGLVALATERVAEAVDFQTRAFEHAKEHDEVLAPRSGAYLVNALGRLDRLEDARRVYAETLALLERGPGGAARATSDGVWLRIQFAEAILDAAPDEVRTVLQEPSVQTAVNSMPRPGLLGRRLFGLALVALREHSAGFAWLAASPTVYGAQLEPHRRFLAQLNVLYEARARLQHGLFDDDARARTELALGALPSSRALGELLQGPALELRARLTAGRSPQPTLDHLLALCRRFE